MLAPTELYKYSQMHKWYFDEKFSTNIVCEPLRLAKTVTGINTEAKKWFDSLEISSKLFETTEIRWNVFNAKN